MAGSTTRGVVFIHSAFPALCPHVESAIARVLGNRVSLDWSAQPAEPDCLRAELSWVGPPGSSARIASALRGWQLLRFEVTEEPSPGVEGSRYCGTPSLGIFSAVTGVHGDVLVREDRLRAAMIAAAGRPGGLEDELSRLLGRPWDEELEPFRHAGEGACVRWLYAVV